MTLHQRPLSTMYDILLLTNSTLITADTIVWCIKFLFPIHYFLFLFHKKNNTLHLQCPLCPPPLASCTTTKYNIYIVHSLPAAAIEPALYRLLTFQVPTVISLSCCLDCTISLGPRQLYPFCNKATF